MSDAPPAVERCACGHDEECHGVNPYAPDVENCRVKRCRCKRPAPAAPASDGAGAEEPEAKVLPFKKSDVEDLIQ